MLCLSVHVCLSKASTLIKEGYLSAITKDLRDHPRYWNGMLKDFPDHPVKQRDPSLRASVGCTLYGHLLANIAIFDASSCGLMLKNN